jgi:hypothetical protein
LFRTLLLVGQRIKARSENRLWSGNM